MANNKDKVPGSFGGSAAGASTTANASNSKLAEPAKKKFKSENNNHPDHSALDDLVFGGCSTCGSFEHDTVQCGKKIPTVYMMSGALQTDAESPAPTTADTSASTGVRDSSVEKGDQAESDGPVSQGKRRRSSM
ncbi:hypothetical protein Daus18300_003520 [Diaporthe australafricana]|uniref:Uncharacterized protein n=1 Tax=Diaporthe australafricana TaxID=127596 RepID=A0ABR3XF00_9PEZI